MDFGAYLASSSSEDGSDDEGEGPSGCGQEAAATEKERIQKYKVQSDTVGVGVDLHLKFNLCCRRCLKNVERTKVKVVLKKRLRSHGSQVDGILMMFTQYSTI